MRVLHQLESYMYTCIHVLHHLELSAVESGQVGVFPELVMCMHVYKCTCIYMYEIYMRMYTYMHMCIHAHLCVNIYVRLYIYVYMYMYAYIFQR